MPELEGLLTFIYEHRLKIASQTIEHLWLTLFSLTLAMGLGVSLGVLITKFPRVASPVLWVVNVVQTIPSVALLAMLLPILGIGATPTILALFLYALLPIVRSTHVGITGVSPDVSEAALGMGLTPRQLLVRVELPLALPVIFAGVRNSAVFIVGVATLGALVAAGGLGEYIFSGIATNNIYMTVAGALPVALLAVVMDAALGLLQRLMARAYRLGLGAALGVIMVSLAALAVPNPNDHVLVGGFSFNFMEREDGYPGLIAHYEGLRLKGRGMEIALLYQALEQGEVQVISGSSTDGLIKAMGLYSLEDDRHFFPPYACAPLVRAEVRERHPQAVTALNQLAGLIPDSVMMQLNYRVEGLGQPVEQVASSWLSQNGFPTTVSRQTQSPDIVIGSKNFTENLILATLFGILIENSTGLDVELKLGFAGTQLVYEALLAGEVDLYPEYTGTGLLVLLQANVSVQDSLGNLQQPTYEYVQEHMAPLGLTWLQPLGFNNTYALLMTQEESQALGIQKISDLIR